MARKGVQIMNTTVRIYRNAHQLADALIGRRTDVEKLIRSVKGFKSYQLIRTGDGGALSITACDDQAGCEESNRLAAEYLRDNLPGITAGKPEMISGEAIIAFESAHAAVGTR